MEDPYAVLSWSFFLLFCFLFFLLLESFLFFLTKLWYSSIHMYAVCIQQHRQAQRFLLLITPCSLILGLLELWDRLVFFKKNISNSYYTRFG